MNGRLWMLPVTEKGSRGKLAAARGQKILQIYAAKKIYAEPLERSGGGNTSGQRVAAGVAVQRGVGVAARRARACYCHA